MKKKKENDQGEQSRELNNRVYIRQIGYRRCAVQTSK